MNKKLHDIYMKKCVRYLIGDMYVLGFWSQFHSHRKSKNPYFSDTYVTLTFYQDNQPIAHLFIGEEGDYSLDYPAFTCLDEDLQFEVERLIQTFSYTHTQWLKP